MRIEISCSGKDNGLKRKIKSLSKSLMNTEPKDGPLSLSSFQTESENNVAKDGTIISTPISIKPNGHLNNNGFFIFCFSYTEENGLK